jgi:hypothetical protein
MALEDLIDRNKYFFFGNEPAGSPLSYEALQTRRKIAAELLGKRTPFPKTAGEGLTYLGEALADRRMLDYLDQQERGIAARDAAFIQNAPGNRVAAATAPTPATSATPATPDIPPEDPRTAASAPEAEGTGGFNFMDAAAGAGAAETGAATSGFNRAAYDQTFAGTPLAGKADRVIELAQQNNIPPALMASIMAHESGQGTSRMVRERNNPAGIMDPRTQWMAGQTYPDIDTGLEHAARVIAKNYQRGGGTIEGMARSYAPPKAPNDPNNLNRFWTGGVSKYNQRFSDAGVPVSDTMEAGTPTGRNAAAVHAAAEEPPAAAAMAQGPVPDERDAIAQALMPPPTAAGIPSLQRPGGAAPQAAPLALGGAAAPPITTDIRPAPEGAQRARVSPAEEEIAPYVPQIVPHPGKEPQRLDRPPDTENATYWKQVLGNPAFGPAMQERAKLILEKEEAARKVIEHQQETDYQRKQTIYQQDIREHEKSVREEPVKRLEYLQKTLIARAAQAVDPTLRDKAIADLARVNSELEKARYEITQRPVAEEKAALENLEKRKQLQSMTGEQAKAFAYYQTAVTRDQQLRHVADDSVLAEMGDNMRGAVPYFGNAMVSPKYRAVKNSADAWMLANVRNETGAVIGKNEIKDYWHLYFPVFGDEPSDVLRKAAAREGLVRGHYNALGDVKPAADQFLAERRERRASPAEARSLPDGTRTRDGRRVLVSGYWEDVDPYAAR